MGRITTTVVKVKKLNSHKDFLFKLKERLEVLDTLWAVALSLPLTFSEV